MRAPRAWLLAAALGAGGCATCPPAWLEAPPREAGWLYATGSAGEVFVDADGRTLALTRAARHLADALGLDVERRLSVVLADGRLFVEAAGRDGLSHALDALQLVDLVECDEGVYVLVRLPAPS